MKEKIQRLFSLDLRSLALLRIGIAFLLLLDLTRRVPFITEFYTEKGLFTLQDLTKTSQNGFWSLHALSASPEFQVFLFTIAAIFAFMLLVGYKTKFVTIVSFILLLSLQLRNYYVVSAAEELLRVVLFWGILIPWGARFSLDSLRSSSLRKLPDRVFSIGIFGYCLQIAFLFFFAALFKSSPEWTTNLTAVYFVLNASQVVTPLGKLLLNFPQILPFLTFSVKWFEFLVPFLLFLPFQNTKVRSVTLSLIILMQVSFGVTMVVGTFPLVTVIVIFGLFPSVFWDSAIGKFVVSAFESIFNRVPKFFIKQQKDSGKILDFSLGLDLIALFFIVYILFWNLSYTNSGIRIPHSLTFVGISTGTFQQWNMFAPAPPIEDGWYIVVGSLSNGKKINLLSSKNPTSLKKPDFVAGSYKNALWRKILLHWSFQSNSARATYSAYLCRNWNSNYSHKEKLKDVEITFISEKTLPSGQTAKSRVIKLPKYKC